MSDEGGQQRIPIIGIGASAGGLEALERFFEAVPSATGAAFVVLQHLSPDFESRLDALLGRHTTMTVQHVEDGVRCEPDRVYVAPPNKEMLLAEGKLLLTDRDPKPSFSLPIDHFFRSLAQDAGPLAVAVVLSGTGSDASRGVRYVHDAGGLVVVQSPETARFESMPGAAQTSGPADLVLDPREMGEAIARHLRVLRGEEQTTPSPDTGEDASIEQVLDLLHERYGIDFSGYKPNMVLRRIGRRLALRGARELDSYADALREHPDELDALYHDLLIGVTGFFRDRKAFAALEQQVVPEVVAAGAERGELRIWVPGCATGEEAYSIAILVDEERRRREIDLDTTVFATDVHHRSLEIAAAGLYPASTLEDVGPERRERYFRAEGSSYRVRKELRQQIVFARQNVVKDAPFTRLDLISCRNLLIYLEPALQKKVLSMFHFGLRTGGTLVLGLSETPRSLAEEFDIVDPTNRIYRKRRDIRLPLGPTTGGSAAPQPAPRTPTASAQVARERNMLPIYDALLAQHMPPSLLVGENYELLHSFGGAEQMLTMPAGRTSLNLLELVHPELKTALSGALQHVEREQRAVQYTGIELSDEEQVYRIVVEPFDASEERGGTFLVRFERVDEAPEEPVESTSVNTRQVSEEYIERLETELRYTKENLQATIEELETSNEELQATNQELVAANQELQSTNEELHSVNEELYSVNAEHQKQIDELTELANDMDNLLQSTDIGIVFLDASLNVRKFTTRAANVFHLLSQDVGRPFEHFVQNLQQPDLMIAIRRALDHGDSHQSEVRTPNGEFFLARVLPYRTNAGVTGVVLTLVDIGPLKQSEANVRQLSAIVEGSADAIMAQTLDGKISAWNEGAERMFGYAASEVLGKHVSLLVPEHRRGEVEDMRKKIVEGHRLEPMETVRSHRNGRELDVSISASPIRDEHDRLVGVSSIIRDVGRRRRAERRLRQAMRQRDQFIAQLSHELRNPLMALLTAADLIASPDTTPALRQNVSGTIERQTKQMARILEDLLDVSRMRRDRIELRREVFDLRDVVPSALDEAGRAASSSGVELEQVLPDQPVWVHADRGRVVQATVNLLDNAIKFSPAGKAVTVEVAAESGRAMLRVIDRGRGIPDDMIDDVFDPFHQGDDPLHGGEQSMGLGLSLVQAIASAHGGDVRAESEGLNRGTTFELRLARAKPPSDSEPAPRTGKDSHDRILVVEDQDENRVLLDEGLRRRGYTVVAVGTGSEAVDKIAREAFTCAVVDIGLPDMSGLQVAEKTRSEKNGKVRLVALTGHGQQQDRDAAFTAGFDEHVVKPIDVDHLVRVIEDL